MYRMANWPEHQKEVTGELIRGFQIALNIPRHAKTIEWTEDQVEALKNMLEETPSSCNDPDGEHGKRLRVKLGKMYEELFDPDYSYTYDEYGEYLLAVMMYDVQLANFLADHVFLEPCLNPIDYPSMFDFLLEDIKEEKKEIEEEMEALGEEALGKPDKEFVRMMEDEMCKEAHRRILSMFCFPHMADDDFIIECCSPVFWDMDFTFFFDHSLDEFIRLAESEVGYSMGLVMHVQNREPLSGSIRVPVGENPATKAFLNAE